MRLKAALQGDLKKHMKREYKRAEYAVTRAVTDASYGLKMNMRRQVLSAGLGQRLANTWRDAVYPKGTISTRAAAVVYTRASKIMEGFDQGTVIRSKDGFWLAIPTPNAPKRIMGKKTTPANFEKSRGIRLQFVYRKNGPSLLIAKDMQPSYKRATGELRGFRKASQRTLRTGRGHTSVVMFWLVPQVKMPKHLSFKKEAEKWNGKIPQFILRYWPDEK
jgi:hypothetical protein